jgi:aminopeptidase N
MKTRILSFLTLLLAVSSFAQFNMPSEESDIYCAHMRHHSQNPGQYYSFIAQDPLLDDYDVHFYFLDIQAENNTVSLSGKVTIGAFVTSDELDTFAFELIDQMTVDSVFVNNVKGSFARSNDMGYIPLNPPSGLGDDISVTIWYHGTPPTGGFFSGISTDYSSQWAKDVTWTLSEPYAAKDWWPTKQDLTDKADSAWIFITTSDINMAGSQGLLTHVVPVSGGKLRYEWKTSYPIDYYLISFAVADYQDYSIYSYPSAGPDSLLIQNFIYDSPGCLNYYKNGMDQTAGFIELFSELFGMYPFPEEKYGHCLTELGGGMEHQTMTTIGGFSFSLVAHELGHMWFGDNVTCGTWSDIWINEGFATYSDYLAHHFLADPYYDSLWLKIRHDQVKSQPGGSVYVPESELDDVWRIFDGRLSYSKGALLLHMLRFELQDDDLFFDILRQFGVEYGDSVATGLDFKALAEEMSGMDFTDFFNQWYFGEGYPIFDIVWHQDGSDLFITSYQSSSTSVTPLFKMTVPYQLIFEDGSDTTILLSQDASTNNYTIAVGKSVQDIRLDPEQWILHRLNSLTVIVEEYSDPLNFLVSPNPSSDRIAVFVAPHTGQDFHLIITDLTGRVYYKGKTSGTKSELDISSLSRGVYLLRITDGIRSRIGKFVKE